MAPSNRDTWRKLSISKQEIYVIPVEQITAEPGWQTRDLGDLSSLESSLRSKGMNGVPPITAIIEGDSVIVRQGHRRLQAALNVIASGVELAGLRVIPEPKTSTEEDHIADIYLSNNGKNITVLETAILIKRFIDLGWARSRISERLGLTESYISRLEYLINIPEALTAAINSDVISANTAITEIAAGRLDKLMEKLEIIAEEDLCNDAEEPVVEKEVASVKAPNTSSAPKKSSSRSKAAPLKNPSSRKKPKISGTALSGKITPAKALKLLQEQVIHHLEDDTVVIEMPRQVYCQIFGEEH